MTVYIIANDMKVIYIRGKVNNDSGRGLLSAAVAIKKVFTAFFENIHIWNS